MHLCWARGNHSLGSHPRQEGMSIWRRHSECTCWLGLWRSCRILGRGRCCCLWWSSWWICSELGYSSVLLPWSRRCALSTCKAFLDPRCHHARSCASIHLLEHCLTVTLPQNTHHSSHIYTHYPIGHKFLAAVHFLTWIFPFSSLLPFLWLISSFSPCWRWQQFYCTLHSWWIGRSFRTWYGGIFEARRTSWRSLCSSARRGWTLPRGRERFPFSLAWIGKA